MKDIEDEIPFDVPEGWAWTKIHCVSSEILYGVSESAKETGKYKLLRITDIQDDQVNWDSVPFTDFPEDKVSNYILKNGDIVFARTGATVGKSYLIENLNIESIYASYLIRIRTSLLLNPRYMKYYFGSLTYWNQITDKSSGIGQPNVNGTSLANLYIPIPPYNEQERILPVIEKVFMLIDSLENDKDKLENLIKVAKSKILDLAIHGKLVPQDSNDEPAEELLKRIATSDNRPYKKFDDDITFSLPKNWEWCYLGDICKVSSAKRVLQQDWKDSGIPFYRAREIAQLSNNENVKDDLFITPELYDELKNKYGVPVSGDLMISAVGTIGKVYIVKESDCFYYKDASVICFSKKEKSIDSKYLKLCLESGFLQNQIYSQSTGTTVDTITINKAQEYLFPLPNIKEQQRIVSKIEELFLYLDTISSNLE